MEPFALAIGLARGTGRSFDIPYKFSGKVCAITHEVLPEGLDYVLRWKAPGVAPGMHRPCR
jgi:hypothetical protein